MTYGPNPWQQTSWDWRAAGNFIGGGAGSGLIVFSVLSGAQGRPLAALLLAGLALVSAGLVCVWLEIGRPLRALHVFINPRSSWMSREALVAPLLFALALGAIMGLRSFAPLAALAAIGFVYCQGRLLQAAKGIPAWREPMLAALIVVTGLAEGAGLFWLAATWLPRGSPLLVAAFAALLLARVLLWRAWRQRIAATAAPRALAAIDRLGRSLLWLGTVLPLALSAVAVVAGEPTAALLMAAAGVLAAATGAAFKFTLVTRAGFNQGFKLVRLPVRGVPR